MAKIKIIKTYDIRPPDEARVFYHRKIKPVCFKRIVEIEKAPRDKPQKDVFAKEFLNAIKSQTISFKKEDFFDEKYVFPKKKIALNEKIKVRKFSFREFLGKLKPSPFAAWQQPLFRFAAGLTLVSLFFPLAFFVERGFQVKEKVVAEAEEGYQHLLDAKNSAEASNFEGAKDAFQKAAASFQEAGSLSANIGEILFFILKHAPLQNKVSSGVFLLEAGEYLSKAGEYFLVGIEPFLGKPPSSYLSEDGRGGFLTDEMKKSQEKIILASDEVEKAEKAILKIKISSLPEEIQGKAAELKEKLPLLRKGTDTILDYLNAFSIILGDREAKKYLFIFQNNREARATGGFIGTYGVIDVDRGRVKKIFVDGIYNPDGQLFEKIIPPKPIQKIDNSWHMRDSNWFSDFPATAKKIASFYEKTGGPTVDGIIAMTPNVIEKLLALTGPIDMPEYGVKIDSNNFVEATQYEVEFDYDKKENNPKKILADLAPLLLDKAFSLPKEKWPEILKILDESIKEKHLLFFFRDEKIQDFVLKYNLGGAIRETNGDFLMVVNSNIGGHKTDFLMDDKIYHQVIIQDDGRIIDEVNIIRKHQGGESEFDLPEAENWHKKTNYNYLRVLAPKGATLIEAQGFLKESEVPNYIGEIDFTNFKRDKDLVNLEDTFKEVPGQNVWVGEESGKTVFSGWVATLPEKESVVTLKYELPFKLDFDGFLKEAESYSLFLEKQAGAKEAEFESTISLPAQKEVKWQYGEGLDIEGNKALIRVPFDQDRYWGIVITK